MAQNPQNASIAVGSPKGIVSVYIPSQSSAAVKINCHNAQVKASKFSSCGRYMASVGSDSSVKIWDVRNTFQSIGEYFSPFPVQSMDVSQKGILALGGKSSVLMFKDCFGTPDSRAQGYLKHVDHKRRPVNSVAFCPFEDFLGVGSLKGFSSITVPGSCFVEFDTHTHNVGGVKAQIRENAVQKLLEKLPMESIVLNPGQIGKVDPTSRAVLEIEKKQEQKERNAEQIRRRKRRKRSKVSAFQFKQNQRNEILRNQMREDVIVRKEVYKAEERKRAEESRDLNQRVPDFVKMGGDFVLGRLFVIARQNDFGEA